MLPFLAALPALAVDAPGFLPPAEPSPELPGRPGEGGGGSSSSSGSSSGSTTQASETVFKVGTFGKWKYQPYVEPGGGVQIGTSDTGTATSIVAGADVGVKYWRKNWTGDLYVGGSYTTGDALNGWEVHLGDQMGRREKWWGLTGGLEAIYAGYTYPDGKSAMKPAFGGGIPVEVVVGPTNYFLFAGAQPNYFADATRGLEVEWHVGAAANLDWFTGTLGFMQYRSAAGVQNTPVLTIGVGG